MNNQRGFSVSGILYPLFIIMLVFVSLTLLVLMNSKFTLDKTISEFIENINTFGKKTGATMVAPTASDTHKGIIYLDPTNLNKKCNSNNSISTTEITEGCMKWYIYDDSGDTYKMILDHNTTARAQYNSDNVNTSMLEVAQALNEDITNWDSSIKSTARLIKANEIAAITGNTSFDSTTSTNGFYFDTNTTSSSANSTNKSKYTWLYDNTYSCLNYGCNGQDSNSYTLYGSTTTGVMYGYWTSTTRANSRSYVYGIAYGGSLNTNPASYVSYGIRPVISISKSIIR